MFLPVVIEDAFLADLESQAFVACVSITKQPKFSVVLLHNFLFASMLLMVFELL